MPWIETVQDGGLIADVKHYAGNNQEGTGPLANTARPGDVSVSLGVLATIGNRMRINARIEERTLRELYLPMFEAAVKRAHVGSVMCAYNKINGAYACENKTLLENILRDDWGFKGFTIADYGGAHNTGPSLTNGLDFEPWPGLTYGPSAVNGALTMGEATMADVDAHVRRYLRTLFAYGAIDRAAFEPDEAAIDQAGNAAESGRVAEEGIVLLKNDGLLPLSAKKLDSIAVIGPGADAFLTGGGSSAIKPFSTTTPFEGIKDLAGAGVDVATDDGSDPAQAAQLAADSDVAIVVPVSYSTEGVDRTCLSFECPPVFGNQDALIRQVADANPETAVVMESGGPMLTPWSRKVGALLEAWYPGSDGGSAIARVLFGKVDASGRLPVTFPKRDADIPTAGNENAYPGVNDVVDYPEGLLVGYRHYEANGIKPAYPVRPRPLLYELPVLEAADRADSGRGQGAQAGAPERQRRRQEHRRPLRRRRPAALPLAAVDEGRASAAEGAQRLQADHARPRQEQAREVPAQPPRLLLLGQDAHRWKVVRGCGKVLVGSSSAKTPLKAPIGPRGACKR